MVEQLVRVATSTEPAYPPSPYVERQIYDGFWSHADGRKLEAFHSASWQERAAIAEGLEDPRLVWLARRIIFVEQPHFLAPEHHASMASEKAGRLMADAAASGGWTTLSKASNDLAAIMPGLDATKAGDFQRLGAYIERVMGEATGNSEQTHRR